LQDNQYVHIVISIKEGHGPSALENEMPIENLEVNNSPSIDKIPKEIIKQEVVIFLRSLHLLSLFGIRRNCLRIGWIRSFYLSLRKIIKQNAAIIEAYHFCQLCQTLFQRPAVNVNSKFRGNYRGSLMLISTQLIIYIYLIVYIRQIF
jgi:hypothetical protein